MKSVFILTLFFASFVTFAQNTEIPDNSKTARFVKREKKTKSFSFGVSFFNHSISVPFYKIFRSPVHPGVQTFIEGRYFETSRSKLFQTLNIGMFYNSYNGTGFFGKTELAYRYTSKIGIFGEALAGIGYLRTYHPTDIYELTSSGTYERAKDIGFSSPIISFAFGLGYSIKSSSRFSFSPFIRYENITQTNYSSELDVLPQSAFHIGLRINMKRVK